jgi:hypothetical protein
MRSMVCVALLFAVSAAAQTPPKLDATAQAKLHFEEGTKAFNLGEFPRAIREYKAAYNAKPEPVILYNIAQACRLGGDLAGAVFFYRSFLRNMPTTPNKREVEARIKALEAQLAQQKALTTAPPNDPVAPGSVPSAMTSEPPTEKPPTERAEKPAVEKPVEKPEKPAEPAPAATAVVTSRPAAPTPVYKKWWLWTAVGAVVVVGVAVGVGVGVSQSGGAPGSHFGTMPVF